MARSRRRHNGGGYDPPPPVDPADRPLDPDEQSFVNEWVIDRNSSAAYRRANPDVSFRSAQEMGRRVFNRPHVKRECLASIEAQRRRCNVSADEALRELCRIAFSDCLELEHPDGSPRRPREIPFETRRAIGSIKFNREREVRRTVSRRGGVKTTTVVSQQVVEYRFWNKLEALKTLASIYNLIEPGLPPLDVLMSLLPKPLADELRTHLPQSRTGSNGSNGSAGNHTGNGDGRE